MREIFSHGTSCLRIHLTCPSPFKLFQSPLSLLGLYFPPLVCALPRRFTPGITRCFSRLDIQYSQICIPFIFGPGSLKISHPIGDDPWRFFPLFVCDRSASTFFSSCSCLSTNRFSNQDGFLKIRPILFFFPKVFYPSPPKLSSVIPDLLDQAKFL